MSLSQKNIILYFKLALPLMILFIVVYGGANWINAQRSDYFNLYFLWEQGIPFIPEMILIYLSIQIMFFLPIFHCDSIDMIVLAKRMAVATLVAGVVFIILPAQPGFVRYESIESFQWLFTMLYSLDEQYNLFPSLHITLSTLVVVALFEKVNGLLKIIYLAWLTALFLSVLFVHQHHILDIIGGLVLTYICTWWITHPGKKIRA